MQMRLEICEIVVFALSYETASDLFYISFSFNYQYTTSSLTYLLYIWYDFNFVTKIFRFLGHNIKDVMF